MTDPIEHQPEEPNAAANDLTTVRELALRAYPDAAPEPHPRHPAPSRRPSPPATPRASPSTPTPSPPPKRSAAASSPAGSVGGGSRVAGRGDDVRSPATRHPPPSR